MGCLSSPRAAQKTHISLERPAVLAPCPLPSPLWETSPAPQTRSLPLSLLPESPAWYSPFTHTELYNLQSLPTSNESQLLSFIKYLLETSHAKYFLCINSFLSSERT